VIDPAYAYAHNGRGIALQSLGRFDEALAAHDRALVVDPTYAQAHNGRGNALDSLGRLDEALEAYDRAIAIDPNFAVAHSNRGNALRSVGRLDEALEAYDRAIAIDPNFAVAHFNRGSALKSLGRFEDALKAYDRAVALGLREALNSLAWLLATAPDPKVRDAPRAVEAARKAVEFAPEDGNPWNTLGVALCRAGSWGDALAAFERSMKIRAGGNAYDWFFVATAHWHLGRRDEANRWYEKAVAWADANRGDDEELRRFREEAAGLIGGK
jgi:tetratricopeptide (TPR) repeat protein